MKESASTYTCRSLSGSVQVNGVDGVILVVIQITDDPSAERTAPPRSTHVQPGDVSSFLIQQGEKERFGEDSIQEQHDGVVVKQERGNPAGLRQAPREKRRTWERGRAAPELG